MNSNEAVDAFWKHWKENGETGKHGYYESTWGAIKAALKVEGEMGISAYERAEKAGQLPDDQWMAAYERALREIRLQIGLSEEDDHEVVMDRLKQLVKAYAAIQVIGSIGYEASRSPELTEAIQLQL